MSNGRVSHVQIRRPSVMLVRIDPGKEPSDLRVDDLPYTVLRVRHPLPAITRMEVLRPAVIVVGRTVMPRDFVMMIRTADEIGASIILAGALETPGGLHDWVCRTVGIVQARREGRVLEQQSA